MPVKSPSMPKKNPFKKSKKKKKKEAADRDVESPLMADSTGDAAKQREAQARKKAREERRDKRKERAERIADSNQARQLESQSKKKSPPKMSRKERDAKDSKLGCCHKFGTLLVKIVHVLDALVGLTFLIYGLLIATQFADPAMDAVITTLTYGSAMLFASIMGAVGFYSPRCKRIGLLISAYSAPAIVLLYLFAIIFGLTMTASIFDYLTEHMDVLYLNEAEIATLKKIMPFFYIVLASLTAIEVCRFLLLSELRATLVRFDSANRRILSSNSSKSSTGNKSSKKSKGAGSGGTGLTPLLGDEEAGDRQEDY